MISPRLGCNVFVLLCSFALAAFCPAQTESSGTSRTVLTPKPPVTPRINGAHVFGVRPGNPFLFSIAATGDRPMKFSAEGLPAGLSLDPSTGRINGTLNEPGETTVTLRAENAQGVTEGKWRIVCGNTIALTPPMGWNSWNCFAEAVDDAKVRAAADAMVSSGLINHGWTYINIDDCWQGDRDASGNIQSNERFPDMKALSNYIHGKGLKFGIYSSPGPKTCAGFTGSYEHEDQDARRYAEWGVDYVKYDWCTYAQIAQQRMWNQYTQLLPDDSGRIQTLIKEWAQLEATGKLTEEESGRLKRINTDLDKIAGKPRPEDKHRIDLEVLQEPYKLFRASLNKVPRDIVYSFCQKGRGDVWEWGQQTGGNCWRTTRDIKDTWDRVFGSGFSQAGHEKYAGPGHWNDPDMLVVGNVGWGPRLHPTHLTPDEQCTHISLWCLLAAPLLIGCDMSQLDDFTLGLLSNDEVLAVDQDPLGRAAGRISQAGSLQVWKKELEDGSQAVGLFNTGSQAAKVTATWSDLGIRGKQLVRDLWRQRDLGNFDDKFEALVPSHGVALIKVKPVSQ